MSQNKFIELSALQNFIKGRIGLVDSWVRVEIESHREVNGHHYLNVLEKAENGTIAAKASAVIWRSRASIINKFIQITGKGLDPGIAVVVRVTVDYHPQYGLSLNITDIDPSFSIGLRELEKKETIRKLTEAGLIDRQKSLELPYLPSSIAIISSQDAAGYGDFVKHLEGNAKKFRFHYTLFHSLMQGQNAPASMTQSLKDIKDSGLFNMVLILRGGGAESDLFCYDDYNLCKAMSEFPIPVLTAIGHERDYHVADMVANCHFKTPTALADKLIDMMMAAETEMANALTSLQNTLKERLTEEDRMIGEGFNNVKFYLSENVNEMTKDIGSVFGSISTKLALRVVNMSTNIDATLNSIVSLLNQKIGISDSNVSLSRNTIYHCAEKKVGNAESSIKDMVANIEKTLNDNISNAENEISRTTSTIQFALASILNNWEMRVALIDTSIKSSDPRGLLRQGYVLAVDKDGTILKNVHSKSVGEDFSVKFSDGLWDCQINEVKEIKQ